MYTLWPLPPEHWDVKKNNCHVYFIWHRNVSSTKLGLQTSILNYAYWLKKGILHSPEAETLLTVLLK